MGYSHLLFMGMPGGMEWIIILVIALLIFGARLPSVMRSLGGSVREFKRGMDVGDESEDEKSSKKVDEQPPQQSAERHENEDAEETPKRDAERRL